MLQRVVDNASDEASLSPAQQRVVADEMARRLRLQVQKMALSRGGLADLVAALGDPRLVSHGPAHARGAAVAEFLFHGGNSTRAVLQSAGHRARVAIEHVEDAALASLASEFARLADGLDPGLRHVYARMPRLLHLPVSSVHGDIADVVRRGCGVGPFGRVALRRHLRGLLAQANRHGARGITGWFLAHAMAPAGALGRRLRAALSAP